MEKVCKECRVVKPFQEFNKHIADGPLVAWNLRFCKDCAHEKYVRRYGDPKAKRAMTAASKNWKINNPDQHAKLAREYRQRHPEKILARNKLAYAVRSGAMQRGSCERCGATEKVHAHHHISYEPKDWYNVRWLCFVCHKLEHAEEVGVG